MGLGAGMAEGEKPRQYPGPLHAVLPWDALVQTGLCGPTRNQALSTRVHSPGSEQEVCSHASQRPSVPN